MKLKTTILRAIDRVKKYAGCIAEGLELDKKTTDNIQLACQLHDLGKIHISQEILNKPGKLSDKEWGEIKLHPAKSAEILKPLAFLKKAAILVEQHHEYFDGNGYPAGLRGGEIDLGARIISVADSFDAMTTERFYAKALDKESSIKELERCKGSQFDPEVVDIFVKLLKTQPELF